MAQYREDWSASTVGATTPTGWTKRWVTTSNWTVEADDRAPARKRVSIANASAIRSALTRNDVDADANADEVDIIALIECFEASASTASSYGGLVGRLTGAAASENGVWGGLGNDAGVGTEDIRIGKYVSGTSTADGDPPTDTWVIDTLYWVRLTINGGTATVRLYAADTPMRGTPIAEHSYSTSIPTGDGGAGLFQFASTGSLRYLYVGIGTNGDVAPLPVGYDELYLTDSVAIAVERAVHAIDGLYMYDASSSEWPGAGGGGGVLNEVNISDGLYFTDVCSGQSRGIRLPLYGGSTPRTSVNSIVGYWWDAAPSSLGTPTRREAGITTDANSGYMRMNLEAVTAKAVGDLGTLFLHKQETDPRSSWSFISQVSLQNLV